MPRTIVNVLKEYFIILKYSGNSEQILVKTISNKFMNSHIINKIAHKFMRVFGGKTVVLE